MKHTYESFTEMASDFTDGDSWTHRLSDHSGSECFGWQHGVKEFAKWLDEVGVEMIKDPEIYDKLWENIRTHKPEQSVPCSK